MSNNEYLTIQIGAKIKSLRKSYDLKLGGLAEKSGISIAMISKIENGRVFPTFPTLIQILKALHVDLNDFFADFKGDEAFPGFMLRRASEYKSVEKEEDSVGFHYLSVLNHTVERSSMEISLLTVNSGARRAQVSTSGLEYIYMLKGQVEYELGNDTFTLFEGDSLLFDGNILHVPRNIKEEDAVLLVIYFIDL